MKAAIYQGKHSIEIRELPLPVLGPRDVLIQNICSSICGTDVAVYQHGPGTGHRITVGGEFGHETVSRVAAVGEAVTDFAVGERVYPYPRFATGDTRRAGTIGGFSEYIRVPDARRDHALYHVPDCIPDRWACLIEPFTVGCRAARRGQPRAGETAAVFGAGTIGMAAAIMLREFGVRQVLVCDRSEFRLAIAEKLGFAVCNVEQQDFAATACAHFGAAPALGGEGPDIDCYMDAAGAESVLDTFMACGKFESRFVSVAVNNAIRRLDLLHLTFAQKSLIGSGGYMPEDVRDVMRMMERGRWDLDTLITHEFPLARLAEAIETASDPDHAGNVVIRF